jgi:hypothetical protein
LLKTVDCKAFLAFCVSAGKGRILKDSPMTIHELKAELAARMEPLALALLPEPPTTKTRHELRFGAKGALAVRIAGAKRGTFCDYAAGAKGDALAFIAHARQCPPREAFQWARQWLGGACPPPPAPNPPMPAASPAERAWSLQTARNLWHEALPAKGSLAETYLAARGLALPATAPLAFHPRAWRNKEHGPPCPAMLALMTEPETGAPVGVHVTYLARDGVGKAPGTRAKVMLGKAGLIRLASIEGAGLGLAEGIETALAVMQRAGWAPVWAATSAGAVARFPILPAVECLTVFGDADPPGMSAARQAAQRWRDAGKQARICAPPAGDWDDALRGCRA